MRMISQNAANGNRGWEAESGKRKAEGETRTNAVVAAAVSAAQYDPQDRLLSYDSATYQYNDARLCVQGFSEPGGRGGQ
jgi:hypothetical protein